MRKRTYRQKKNVSKPTASEYQRWWRAKKKSKTHTDFVISPFPNRQNKSRALKKLKNALPRTPAKRAGTIAAYLESKKSPAVQTLRKSKIVSSPEDVTELKLGESVIEDLRHSLNNKKRKRSDENRIELNTIMSSVCGESVSKNKCKLQLAKKLCIPARTVSKGHRIRAHVSHSDTSCFKYTQRKTRTTTITEETKKLMYNFWCSADISHPTGNKKDIKRVRIGVKSYSSHEVYILRKSQTEAFVDFKEKYPDIQISQRTFERCKPYFIREARPKDRITCCCRYHLEMRSLFRTCMDFRRKHVVSETHTVYENMSSMCSDTLCAPDENGNFNRSCLERECPNCGITDNFFHDTELSTDETTPTVKWEQFEYKDIEYKGRTIRKLLLTKKTTKAGEMFAHMKDILRTFPAHNFRAKWQHNQFSALLENLPINHCITVHDFSENFKCSEKVEIQSNYFSKTEATLHVTLLYRHAALEVDGPDSPDIVCEQFFVISPDEKHDHFFTERVQYEVAEYLRSISYQVDVMHEYCDGCAAQYKSRVCYGELPQQLTKLGYKTLIRNFYETSHAKGPQDAAGGFIKRQADIAILRGTASIQCAKDLFTFAQKTLTETKSNKSRRRVFRYCDDINRNNEIDHKPIPGIRSTHQVIVHKEKSSCSKIGLRFLSCYECEQCVYGDTSHCKNKNIVGETKAVTCLRLNTKSRSQEECITEIRPGLSEMVNRGTIFAVVADDPNYEYYLIRADTGQYVLDRDETDSWGAKWNAGTSVIKGKYFQNNPAAPLKYKLVKEHVALVPALSVIFILETQSASRLFWNMPEDDHLKILQLIDEIEL